jgi:LDH2 family malate/lactate/ureidoglycolate dehydrogenase
VAFLPVLPGQPGKGLGHFFGAIRVDAFRRKEDFLQAMDTWIEAFSQTTPLDAATPVIIPGQPEFAAEQDRSQNGIPLLLAVVEDLEKLGAGLDLTF